MKRLALAACLTLLAAGCGGPAKPEVWIYTSIYNDVLEGFTPGVQAKMPEVELSWYKAGSEEVAARVTAELAAGGTRADVLMTADVFWYESLRQENHLLELPRDLVERVPERLRDPDHRYVASRAAAMVLVVNESALGGAPVPTGYADLAKPALKDKVVIGDPLKSGTHFVTLALLSRKLGWDWYRRLRANDVVIEGGNSAVLRRVETGDRPVGLLLLENWLKAKQGGSTTRMVVPAEGAIIIPSPIAVMRETRHRDEAIKLCRMMLEKEGQEAMVRGWMYAPVPGIAPPPGAPTFDEISKGGIFPDPALIREVATTAEELKETFVKEMFE